MTVSIHQPQYISWVGYFNKMVRSDMFVYLDTCQYLEKTFQNRNKIFYEGKLRWLSIPIVGRRHVSISDITVDNSQEWQKKQWQMIQFGYKKSDFFEQISASIEKMYKIKLAKLADYVIQYDDIICNILDIKTERIKASNLPIDQSLQATDRLVAICNNLSANIYLSGIGGEKYMEFEKFKKNNIDIMSQFFSSEFIAEENPSILDFLFKYGPKETKKIIMSIY
jgi:hypothetical protein